MDEALVIASCALAVLLTTIATTTLVWMMHAWRTPAAHRRTGFAPAAATTSHGFSLIVPCRDESEAVVRPTVAALLAQDHPDLEVIISVGDDDPSTVATALLLSVEDPRVVVSVNEEPVKNKPRQLNTALARCTKDVVGIIDAESLTKPGLLRRVDATFEAEQADVVQGAVQLMNYRATWFTLRNCLEYRIWFRSRLHGHADAGFTPLGGNTVFLRRSVLEEVGGWDGDCLAEDCEIGVRLSARGKRIVCAYDPELVTEELAPTSVAALVKQRTRWALGFMQVLAKGDWKTLPTRRRRWSAWLTLVQQHAMVLAGLALPVAVLTALFVDLPVVAVMIAFLPLLPTLLMLAFDVLILREFGRDMRVPVGFRDYVRLVLSTPFFQVLLALSAIRAAHKFVVGDLAWYKTPHDAHPEDRLQEVVASIDLRDAAISRQRVHLLASAPGATEAVLDPPVGPDGGAPGERARTALAQPAGRPLRPGGGSARSVDAAPGHRERAGAPQERAGAPLRRARRGPSAGALGHGSALAAVLGVIALLAATNLSQFPAYFDDEGTYYSQAWAITELGQLAPYTYWYDHPPLGWIQIAALTGITDALAAGAPAILSGRLLMVGYGLVSAVLVHALARRLGLGRASALLATALWGFSPLVVVEMRQVFLDNVALPWLLGAFVLASSHRRDLWHHCVAGLCFGIAVLSKETLLVAAPALLLVLWRHSYRPTRAFAVLGACLTTALVGTGYLLLAALKTELLPSATRVSLWDALAFQLAERAGSGSLLVDGTEANGHLDSWLAADPVLLLAGLAAGAVCLFVARLRWVGVTLVLFAAVALRPSGYLPGMYVIAVLPFAALAVAGVLDLAARASARIPSTRWRRAATATGVLALCAALVPLAPLWAERHRAGLAATTNTAHDQALAWMTATLPRDSLVVSDNTYWNDLVEAGWSPDLDGAVWFYKVDLDPVFTAAHPRGWREIDYLVWNEGIALNGNFIDEVRAAHAHSDLLVAFGTGRNRVEIRRVDPS